MSVSSVADALIDSSVLVLGQGGTSSESGHSSMMDSDELSDNESASFLCGSNSSMALVGLIPFF